MMDRAEVWEKAWKLTDNDKKIQAPNCQDCGANVPREVARGVICGWCGHCIVPREETENNEQ